MSGLPVPLWHQTGTSAKESRTRPATARPYQLSARSSLPWSTRADAASLESSGRPLRARPRSSSQAASSAAVSSASNPSRGAESAVPAAAASGLTAAGLAATGSANAGSAATGLMAAGLKAPFFCTSGRADACASRQAARRRAIWSLALASDASWKPLTFWTTSVATPFSKVSNVQKHAKSARVSRFRSSVMNSTILGSTFTV
mmetsp:Transcript_51288/g.153340  ORF Transcript_51288/g.153340 Transcript_51288/m.153340 type:complete len:203 (+) Transcript_51288:4476-5084(+)